MVRHSNNRRVGVIGGSWRNRKLSFSQVNTYLLHIYANIDVKRHLL